MDRTDAPQETCWRSWIDPWVNFFTFWPMPGRSAPSTTGGFTAMVIRDNDDTGKACIETLLKAKVIHYLRGCGNRSPLDGVTGELHLVTCSACLDLLLNRMRIIRKPCSSCT